MIWELWNFDGPIYRIVERSLNVARQCTPMVEYMRNDRLLEWWGNESEK
jgi:hypothetical protein